MPHHWRRKNEPRPRKTDAARPIDISYFSETRKEHTLTKELDFWVALWLILCLKIVHDIDSGEKQSDDQEHHTQEPEQLGNNHTVVRFEHLFVTKQAAPLRSIRCLYRFWCHAIPHQENVGSHGSRTNRTTHTFLAKTVARPRCPSSSAVSPSTSSEEAAS